MHDDDENYDMRNGRYRNEGEEENSHRASSYGEDVFEFIQEIFNIDIIEDDNGAPVTRSRTRAMAQKDTKNRREKESEKVVGKPKSNAIDKKYGSINVRTLTMKEDRYKKEACGVTAAASEWILEFKARKLGVVGLQECRVKGNMVGKEGPYHTFYTGEKDGRNHGVGIYLLNSVISGEVDVQHVSARLMWVVGVIYGVKQAVVSVYAPTNDEIERDASDGFYDSLTTEIKKIRDSYGNDIGIIILGDFNARVGNDGDELIINEDEVLESDGVKGKYGFPEINENGNSLILFCGMSGFKIMDTFFEKENNSYGTWRSNRAKENSEYTAVLDHILVNATWWERVKQCGVTDDNFQMPTDHRIVELELQHDNWNPLRGSTNSDGERKRGNNQQYNEDEKRMHNRARFSNLLLHYRRHESPEHTQALREIKAQYERIVAREKEKLKEEESTTEDILHVLERALEEVIDSRWSEGVPPVPSDKPRCWYADEDNQLRDLIHKKDHLIEKWKRFQQVTTPPTAIKKCKEEMRRTERKIKCLLRNKRNQYWDHNSQLLDEAYQKKDMKLYYQRVKALHGKSIVKESSNGKQLLSGQQVRLSDNKTLTKTEDETIARWLQHFTMLFNQPGEVAPDIDAQLPVQQPQQETIRTGPFTELELIQAIKSMQNDKSEGPDGIAVEIDRYAAGEESRATLLQAFNKILSTGNVPALLRDVVITVLYKGKGSKEDCNNYRGISLMAHRGKILERMILNRLHPALKDIVPVNQFGFTTGVGTADAILISRVVGVSAEKEHTGLVRCYIDLTKAYDKVNRELLWKLLRLYGIPEELVRIIISFHEGAVAKLRFNGAVQQEEIRLQRGLKQGSVLSPVLFNIFMGAIINKFENGCKEAIIAGSDQIGIKINYNFSGDLLDPTRLNKKTTNNGVFTLLDVLYADDCVLFANSISAMQTMVTEFDAVATKFGMEVSIEKTKVICNGMSKISYTEAEEDKVREAERHHRTRRRSQWIEVPSSPTVPKISIREKPLEVVSSFKYLGLHDTDDGAIENAVRARVIRMEYWFKQFQGRVLTNHKIDVHPRLSVFKTIVMTNGMFACETWNYTMSDIARIERHYFRLLRDVLLIPKKDISITFAKVLERAEEHGIYTVFPMECVIQRQQLKFLWKIAHLEDTAVQKMVLFGKVANKGMGRRGGRKQTYISCLNLALENFSVSMEECIAMNQVDWDFLIDNEALFKAAEKWRAQPRAKRPIDNFWAPRIQSRGKRKLQKAFEDEDSEGEGEDSEAGNSGGMAEEDMSAQSNRTPSDNDNDHHRNEIILPQTARGVRKRYKKLRTGKGTHVVEQSTQDFPLEEFRGAMDVTVGYPGQSVTATTIRAANASAAEKFLEDIASILEESIQESGTRGSTGSRKTDGFPCAEEDTRRREKNFEKRRRKKMAVERKKLHEASINSITAPTGSLQIFLGDTIGPRSTVSDPNILWEHRARLDHT
jgi:exonuclease III